MLAKFLRLIYANAEKFCRELHDGRLKLPSDHFPTYDLSLILLRFAYPVYLHLFQIHWLRNREAWRANLIKKKGRKNIFRKKWDHFFSRIFYFLQKEERFSGSLAFDVIVRYASVLSFLDEGVAWKWFGWQSPARREMHSARFILQQSVRASERPVLNRYPRTLKRREFSHFQRIRASGFALALTWMYDASLANTLFLFPSPTAGVHKLFGLTAVVLDFICANLRYGPRRG